MSPSPSPVPTVDAGLMTGKPGSLPGLDGLDRASIERLLDDAEAMRPLVARPIDPGEQPLRDRLVANLFFEDSTRTRCSFSAAAARLGVRVIDLTGQGSSLSKGETLVDTALNIEAMGVEVLVIRASAAGAPHLIDRHVACPVINAGDGRHEHPTQGLLDALTLRQALGDLGGKRVGIVGDIAGSRVARSNLHGLTTLGADVVLIGPPTLTPGALTSIASGPGRVEITDDFDAALDTLDAVMMLRVQFERGSDITPDYRARYGLTADRLGRLRDGAPVLHPGPMNRGIEIDGAAADDPDRSWILRQVTNGVAVRMAVLRAAFASAGGGS